MDPLARTTGFLVKTTAFEGPFELVLDLIEKRKLLVNELALASITEDFVAHVRAQDVFPVRETAQFIQIAATLLLIKSKSLIPNLELSDEEKEDVADFERRLVAYEKVREASRELAKIFGKTFLFPEGERRPEVVFAPARDLSVPALTEALARVLATRKAVEELPTARVRPMITIEEMMDKLSARVQNAFSLSFKDFTGSAKEKVEVIVSFLALLELVKQGALSAEQGAAHGDISISRAGPPVPHYG